MTRRTQWMLALATTLGCLLAMGPGPVAAQPRADQIDPEAELVVAMPDDTQNMDPAPRHGLGPLDLHPPGVREPGRYRRPGTTGARPGPVVEAGGRHGLGVRASPGRPLPQRRAARRRHPALQPRPHVQEEPGQVGHQGRARRRLRPHVPVRLPLGEGQRPDGAHPHHRARADALGLHRPRAPGPARLHHQEWRRRAQRAAGGHRPLAARRVEAEGLDAPRALGRLLGRQAPGPAPALAGDPRGGRPHRRPPGRPGLDDRRGAAARRERARPRPRPRGWSRVPRSSSAACT